MIRRPPRSTLSSSSAASDVYKRQVSTQSTGATAANDNAPHRDQPASVMAARPTDMKFSRADLNQDGVISRDEFNTVFATAAKGLTPPEPHRRSRLWDSPMSSPSNGADIEQLQALLAAERKRGDSLQSRLAASSSSPARHAHTEEESSDCGLDRSPMEQHLLEEQLQKMAQKLEHMSDRLFSLHEVHTQATTHVESTFAELHDELDRRKRSILKQIKGSYIGEEMHLQATQSALAAMQHRLQLAVSGVVMIDLGFEMQKAEQLALEEDTSVFLEVELAPQLLQDIKGYGHVAVSVQGRYTSPSWSDQSNSPSLAGDSYEHNASPMLAPPVDEYNDTAVRSPVRQQDRSPPFERPPRNLSLIHISEPTRPY
eukprot:TRINITY_DN9990_c0_g1_i1.p1 TRINITY_DN9990_c0_g1~~TRINITY_DN9990_c0_g1_i1.p1  ORF type:complete len:371 (+),score=90.87 TRINITY_DN9990_c0_g1_i1:56-1168(+)